MQYYFYFLFGIFFLWDLGDMGNLSFSEDGECRFSFLVFVILEGNLEGIGLLDVCIWNLGKIYGLVSWVRVQRVRLGVKIGENGDLDQL